MFQRVQCEPIYIYTLCCDLIIISYEKRLVNCLLLQASMSLRNNWLTLTVAMI